MSVAQRHDRVQPPSAGEPSPALAAIVDFGRRFGRAHVALAMHAAVPLGLTPELLHVIRFNCVRGVPRIAEADLLLSPLCRDMGRGFYQMPRDVRDLLIDELRRDAELGDPAVKRVAGLLLAYAEQSMATARDVETRAFLRAQQWAGLAVLRPASAARALAAAIRDGLAEGSRADVLRAANVAQALAGPLCGEERVLLYATGLQRLYAGKHSQAAASFQDAEAADRPAAIGDVALPSLRQLTQAMVHRAAAPSGETQTPVRVLYENVQVTVYVPRTVRPEEWYSLPVFTHLDEKPSGAGDDVPDPLAEVKRAAQAILGPQTGEYRHIVHDLLQAVPQGGEITLVPEIEGVEVNPPQMKFFWLEAVNRSVFRFRAAAEQDGRVVRGRLSVFLGVFLLADVPLAFRVDRRTPREPSKPEGPPPRYRKIFVSYSHRDSAIVDQFERFASMVGDRYMRDWHHLRAGENWSSRLREMIEEADVFLVFWSSAAATSEFVRREWEYALSLKRPNFIRVLCPEGPPPDLPVELRHIPVERPTLPGNSPAPPRKVFLCYAREDAAVVEQLKHVETMMGDLELSYMDTTSVETGEDWWEQTRRAIDEADVFQLLWSRAASSSEYVRRAYEYAMSLDRPGFVRPVYWEEPVGGLLSEAPEELQRLHFQRLRPPPPGRAPMPSPE